MVWIIIFISKCKKGNVSTPFLSVPEFRTAESTIIALVQQGAYPQEYKELRHQNASKPIPLMYLLGLYKGI